MGKVLADSLTALKRVLDRGVNLGAVGHIRELGVDGLVELGQQLERISAALTLQFFR